MGRIKKVLILLLLVFVTVFGVAGCNDGNKELLERLDGLQSQLAEMEGKIDLLEEELENLKKQTQDYGLIISADKQVYEAGEEIYISISLENRSGTDKEIAYYLLFYPESSTGQFPADEQPPVTTKKTFKNGEVISITDRLGGCFPAGQHELKYKALFYLSWEMTEFGYETTDSAVLVYSNTIDISVTN